MWGRTPFHDWRRWYMLLLFLFSSSITFFLNLFSLPRLVIFSHTSSISGAPFYLCWSGCYLYFSDFSHEESAVNFLKPISPENSHPEPILRNSDWLSWVSDDAWKPLCKCDSEVVALWQTLVQLAFGFLSVLSGNATSVTSVGVKRHFLLLLRQNSNGGRVEWIWEGNQKTDAFIFWPTFGFGRFSVLPVFRRGVSCSFLLKRHNDWWDEAG